MRLLFDSEGVAMIGWFRLRNTFLTSGEIITMSLELGISRFDTAGRVIALWSWCDTQLKDGRTRLSPAALDAAIFELDGFSDAMVAVGWLELDDDGLVVIPRFEDRFSVEAKRRATEAARSQSRRAASKNPSADRTSTVDRPESDRTPTGKRPGESGLRLDEMRLDDETPYSPPPGDDGRSAAGGSRDPDLISEPDPPDEPVERKRAPAVPWSQHLEHAQRFYDDAKVLDARWNKLSRKRQQLLRQRCEELGVDIRDPDAVWAAIRQALLDRHGRFDATYCEAWSSGRTLENFLSTSKTHFDQLQARNARAKPADRTEGLSAEQRELRRKAEAELQHLHSGRSSA
jgi:hypothetical protein